jgi:RimJ/RimL family protein N-acetyltransferase
MLTINFHPFQNLETERLLLRRINENDADEVLALRGNPEIMKYIPRPLPKTKEEALEHIAMIEYKIVNNIGINWGITIKGNDKIIGIIQENPFLFPVYNLDKGIRKCVIHERIVLYYRVNGQTIELILFWNTYRDTSKLKL